MKSNRKNSERQQQTLIDIDDVYKCFEDLNKPPEISDEINSIVDMNVANLQLSNLNCDKLNKYLTQI